LTSLKNYILFIWNGGLNPEIADPGQLRQRRTLSTMTLLLLPVALTLVWANYFIFDAAADNPPVLAIMVIATSGLLIQAYKGWEQFPACLLVGIIWLGAVTVILRTGYNTDNWVWLLPAVLIAHLITSRLAALLFSLLVIVTLLVITLLTNSGYLVVDLRPENHAIAVAIAGSFNFVCMCVVGYAFRTNQIITESMLADNARRLDREADIRYQAEQEALAGQRAKDIFLTTISHELRTPLNGVIGAGQLLTATDLDGEQLDLTTVLNDSGETLLELINNVLDLSRLEAGGLELEQEPMHLASVVKNAMAPFVVKGTQKKIRVSYQIAKQVPEYIISDSTRFSQILDNLCSNALKFTDTGSIKLVITSNRNSLLIKVSDTGIGINSEEKEKLLLPFTQADSTNERRFDGSGLGLTIVSQLVTLFEGKLSVQSKPGVGSSFSIVLPLILCDEPTPGINKLSDQGLGTRVSELTILVADDNKVNRKVARKMLEQLGYNVEEAIDGNEAIASVQRGNIDLVLMDVQMPRLDGLAATQEIRSMESQYQNTPIVGLTADIVSSDKHKLLAAGMDKCLTKPIRINQLSKILTDVHHSRL